MNKGTNLDTDNKNSPFRGSGGLRYLDCLLAALIGFYVVYMFTRYSGIGISPDSIMYASTAQNLHDHFSIITFNNTPLVFFPVFYPFFLSICIFLSGGTDPVTAAPVINGLLFATTIFLSGWVTTKFKNSSPPYMWLILAAVILSPGLQEIYTYLWSETLFITETLIFVVVFYQYQQQRTIRSLVIVSIIAAVSLITRYAGITIIMTGGLMILLDGQLPVKKKINHLLTFGFIGLSLVVGNMIMNAHNTGLSTGTREPSITSLSENMHYFGTVIIDWMGLPPSCYPIATALTATIALILIGMLAYRVVKKTVKSYESIIICYALMYTLFIVIFATISRFERLNSRLISPLYVPLVISLTWWAPDLLKRLKGSTQILIARVLVVIMLFFLNSIYLTDADTYGSYKEYGIPGYTDDDWNKSDFVLFMKSHKYSFKPGIPIYSDADEAVYIFARIHSTLLPHKFFKKDVEAFYKQKSFYLIDFKKLENPEILSLKDIQEHKKLTKLYDFKDGAVYLCGE